MIQFALCDDLFYIEKRLSIHNCSKVCVPCLFMDIQKEVMLQVTNGKKVLNLAKVAPSCQNTYEYKKISL